MAQHRRELEADFGKQLDTAVLLAMAMEYGANVERLIELTGMPRDFVELVGKRMVGNGIWVNGKPGFEEGSFSDPAYFYVEFTLHVLVAEGSVVRVVA